MRFVKLLFLIIVFPISCLRSQQDLQTKNNSISALHLIGEYVVPHNKIYNYTTIGGLSGIDYDAANDEYYLISDDRSAINSARFYKAKIHYNEKGIDSVQFMEVNYLLQANGNTFPNSREDPSHTPDPESIRYNSKLKQLAWTSEGERIIKGVDTVLNNPAITMMQRDGIYIGSLPIPANLVMHGSQKGPRKNGTLEGLSYSDDFTKIFVSLEEPLYEDGPKVGLKENKVPIRIYEYDVAAKKNIGQYAYVPDPVAFPANPETDFKINGVPEILFVEKNKLIVIERSFSTGRLACTVRVYLTDLSKADNVMSVYSLKDHPPVHPASKKLLLNMDSLGIYIDNIEGVTWGKDLPNGHKTLIFVADNNFEFFEKTQFLVFEVMP